MRFILANILLLFIFSNLSAQDLIVKFNSKIIEASGIILMPDSISYKDYNSLVKKSISKSDVNYIQFENGKKLYLHKIYSDENTLHENEILRNHMLSMDVLSLILGGFSFNYENFYFKNKTISAKWIFSLSSKAFDNQTRPILNMNNNFMGGLDINFYLNTKRTSKVKNYFFIGPGVKGGEKNTLFIINPLRYTTLGPKASFTGLYINFGFTKTKKSGFTRSFTLSIGRNVYFLNGYGTVENTPLSLDLRYFLGIGWNKK